MNRTLENTIFYPIYNLTWSNDDYDLFDKINIGMIVVVLFNVVLNIIKIVPYGKTAVTSQNQQNCCFYPLSSKFVWRYGFIGTIIMPVLLIFLTPCAKIKNFCNSAGLAIHLIHYFNRTIIYPSKISPNATPQTLWFFLLMVPTTTLHGLIQSHHLLNVHSVDISYLTYFGISTWLVGATINIYHDNLLLHLRKESSSLENVTKDVTKNDTSNYRIPKGGLFEYISCANYFGELMEWWSYFMVTRGLPQMLFALFATTFLGFRARFAHKFYKDKFGSEYPAKRKAIIPFIF